MGPSKSFIFIFVLVSLSVRAEQHEEDITVPTSFTPDSELAPEDIVTPQIPEQSIPKADEIATEKVKVIIEDTHKDDEKSTTEAPHKDDEKEVEHSTSEAPPKDIEKELENLENTNPLIVEISTGKVEGREETFKDGNETYYAFQGIPYAKPPIGDLRFREPAPAEKWNKTLRAFFDPPRCVQSISVSGSEDCLYLNVFSPKLPNKLLEEDNNKKKDNDNNNYEAEEETSLLPVMVWIYGGAFVSGQASIEKFGPDFFLAENVIVVSFNYRVGVFGFLSTEDYAATGNWGLKDQILALRWVQENIKKFGGNPNNVTLFGESAGSACVSILVQSPLARGLFHRAIMQSGTSLNSWSYALNPRKTAFEIGKHLDINTDDSKILVEQLRKVDFRTLHSIAVSEDIKELVYHNVLNGLVFAPTTEVNHPGAVLTNNSHSILKNGDFNRVPVMVGFNSQEGVAMINVLDYIRPYIASFDLFSTRLVPVSLNMRSNLQKIVVSRLIRMKYFGWTPIVFAKEKLAQFITDDQFARPIYEYVRQSSKFAPTYFYIFSYEGALGVHGNKREYTGVGHAEDNTYLWNKDTNIDNAPEEDITTRIRMTRLWTNFAKTGNPTPIADPLLQDVAWPPANVKAMVYLNIGSSLRLNTDVSKYSIEFWDAIFKRFGTPPYHTY